MRLRFFTRISICKLILHYNEDWFACHIMEHWGIHSFIYLFGIFFQTALLRYNSHTIQFTSLNCSSQWFLVYSESCTTITVINFRTFSSPHKEILYPVKQSLPIHRSSSSWQPLICFLSLWICLFWTFHINGIIDYVAFCIWLLLLSIMFLKFILAEACISSSFLFMAK